MAELSTTDMTARSLRIERIREAHMKLTYPHARVVCLCGFDG